MKRFTPISASMELIVKGSFYRDLITHSDKHTLNAIYSAFRNISEAKTTAQIQQLKKLRDYKSLYRVKVANDYRLGLVIRGNKVWVTRFCHRSIFYKEFP